MSDLGPILFNHLDKVSALAFLFSFSSGSKPIARREIVYSTSLLTFKIILAAGCFVVFCSRLDGASPNTSHTLEQLS